MVRCECRSEEFEAAIFTDTLKNESTHDPTMKARGADKKLGSVNTCEEYRDYLDALQFPIAVQSTLSSYE
jgi:hypothetical protein